MNTNPNHAYGNVTDEALHKARECYANAFLLHCELERYQTVIDLLDEALLHFPGFSDAYHLREEVWHEYLKSEREDIDLYRNDYLQSEAWEDKKAQVRKHYGERCVCCNEEAEHVHHRTYDNIGKEPLSDLAPMCKSCHKFADQQRKKVEKRRKHRQPGEKKGNRLNLWF